MYNKDKRRAKAQEQNHMKAAKPNKKVNTQKTKQHKWLRFVISEACMRNAKGSKLETGHFGTIELILYTMII